MKVKVTCYGQTKTYTTAKKAIKEFMEGMLWCDPNSSEYARYAIIVHRLMCGETEVNDQY